MQMAAPELASCILVLYVQPLLCLLGTLFNSACLGIFVMVWNNREYYRKTSLILYLGAVSLCNIVQFIDDVRFPSEAKAVNEFNLFAVKACYPLLMAANYASIWLLALVCAQRFQAICHPSSPWKQRLQFVRHSKLCIGVCAALALAVNAIRWMEFERAPDELADSKLRHSTLYTLLQEGLLYGLAVYALPMLLLIWLNYNTMRIIADSAEHRHAFESRLPAEHRTALMTICVFCAFALCTTLSILLRLIIIVAGNLFAYAEFAWLPDVSNLLMNANCLIMPVVFFVFTRGFRDLFFALRQHRPISPTTVFSRQSLCIDAPQSAQLL